ncbi:hypothetical protein COCNU_02G008140 [Cocos nucifera]|uniref:RIN4 pathogenic type III effector avirulence factor Avr cleavage site domain-containing protein n=1 Tax=Cocos nucifera TaxID=13894 RepID=A0A8K0MWP0_COCNU|nr:hypothetical protein COCNU_02G008140 [Cocos nucifera]
MEDVKKRQQIPAFGSWNCCDEVPITEYFESVRRTGLIQANFFGGDGEDLFKRNKGGGGKDEMKQYERERRKPKPSGGDLYKIPPEDLYQGPKKASVLFEILIHEMG